MDIHASRRETTVGLAYGIAAYGAWGVVPVFWKWLTHVPIWEVGAHRIVWGCGTFLLAVALRRRGSALRAALRNPRVLRWLALSAMLLATNWLVFIHAVSTDRVLHASLGYFINPLVSVVLGMLFLRERLSAGQWVAVALAVGGVGLLATQTGGVPWISLALAGSFGVYGLIRKTIQADALPGSALETIMLLPVGLAYAGYLQATGSGAFGLSLVDTALLLATGLVTALPLWWFASAARRLRLSTLGFLQYLAPSGQFVLAVTVYREPLPTVQLASFGLIWAGLAVFSTDAWFRLRT